METEDKTGFLLSRNKSLICFISESAGGASSGNLGIRIWECGVEYYNNLILNINILRYFNHGGTHIILKTAPVY